MPEELGEGGEGRKDSAPLPVGNRAKTGAGSQGFGGKNPSYLSRRSR